MKLNRIFLLFALLMPLSGRSQTVTVGNGIVHREICCADSHIVSMSYKLNDAEFLRSGSREFSVLVNDNQFTGLDDWTDISVRDMQNADGGRGTVISFTDVERKIRVSLSYVAWPGIPVMSKSIRIENTGSEDIKVEGVDVEDLSLNFDTSHSRIYHQYGRHQTYEQYEGDWNDPLVIVHESDCYGRERGVAIGNETIGVIKRTSVFHDGIGFQAGLTHPGNDYPFRRWLRPGESWTSATVFTALYDGDANPQNIVSTSVQDYIRRHMGTRVEQIHEKPTFVYNTWCPFGRGIDEKLIMELADAAAECGVKEFVIDDGWQRNEDPSGGYLGDWIVDKEKFPNGLKPVFDHIRELGMKPGLWISLCGNSLSGKPYMDHPEWMVRDSDGNLANLHGCFDNWRTACLGTDWYGYIRDMILRYVREFGLSYVKLDFAIATSAYVYDKTVSGCYATDHPYHRDWQESFDVIYERCMKLFDELHREAPELFIDCTYESAGKNHLMDYGIARHAEGNWLTNITAPFPGGASTVRTIGWIRTPALPATSLVIGNLRMDEEGSISSFKSLAGTLPIMLGDIRALSPERRSEFRAWASWMQQMEDRHSVMSFRQDLPGFSEPVYGSWDGFMRINTETQSGGFVGVFRNGSAESSRTVTVPGLDPESIYDVRIGVSGKRIARLKGSELAEHGFIITLDTPDGAELVEIAKRPQKRTM